MDTIRPRHRWYHLFRAFIDAWKDQCRCGTPYELHCPVHPGGALVEEVT